MGKGFLKGTQTGLNFVPIQSTDFIFSVIGEEFGFIGSFFFIIIYIIFLYRILFYLKTRKIDLQGFLVILFFQFIYSIFLLTYL